MNEDDQRTSPHDLVVRDLMSRDPKWDLSVGKAWRIRDAVVNDLMTRKGAGRYGSRPASTGDFLRDLYEDLCDASVSSRGRLAAIDEDSLEFLLLFDIYDSIVEGLVKVRRMMDAATE
jgi:hypothetical protein